MNFLELGPADRPPFETRERLPGKIEVACPVCGRWRQGFLLEALSAEDALLRGVDWACDIERSEWLRADAVPAEDERPPISSLAFINLFTLAEKLAAYASDDAAVRMTIGDAQAAGTIHLDDPRVADGLDLLESVGIIAAARIPEILAGTPPQ